MRVDIEFVDDYESWDQILLKLYEDEVVIEIDGEQVFVPRSVIRRISVARSEPKNDMEILV